MSVCHLRYQTSSSLITTSWAAIHRPDGRRSYHALGCQPDPDEPSLPLLRSVSAPTAMKAYNALVELTRRPWCIAIPERDLLEIPSSEWRELVRAIPKIQMVSDVLWERAELMWRNAKRAPEKARGLWLSLTAAHADELQLLHGASRQ